MIKKILVVPLLAASLVACGGGKDETATNTGAGSSAQADGVNGAAPSDPAASGSASPTACPTKATKSFAKTRFTADMGLAFGTFHRWIYKPYQAGTFKSGAQGQKTAIAKAVAAGAFAVSRLNAGRKLVTADPTLCKYLKAPVDSVAATVQNAVNGLKSGDTSAIAGAGAAIDSAQKAAQGAGVNITDKTPPGGF
ncbi:hypothetical protein GCM10027589_19070 [Actinocorallia lasiicapitis]